MTHQDQQMVAEACRNKHSENDDKPNSRITQSTIGNTLYIVESVQSATASETVRNKLKRLILNNAAHS